MGRFPQDVCAKGSQRWVQTLVNDAPRLLDEHLGLGPIEWCSPLKTDDYAEYRDQAVLDRLKISLPKPPFVLDVFFDVRQLETV